MGPALFLPVAGMAMNYFNQKHASDAAQSIEGGAAGTQAGYRTAALSDVNKQANNILNSNPTAAANAEQGSFIKNLRANVGGAGSQTSGPTSALGPVAGANKRYGSDTNASAATVQNYGNTNAGEMSAIDTAVNQRKNEALQMQTLGTTLNGLNQQSYSQNFVDQMRAQLAGRPNPWVSMFSKGLETAGMGMAQNGWFGGNGPPSSTAVTFDASNPLNLKTSPVPAWTGGNMFPQN
jgi:hypothetical protein